MKNGFTLIELIATITLVALVLVIGTSSTAAILKENNRKMHDEQIASFIDTVKVWALDHTDMLPKPGEYYRITIKDLSDDKYIPDNTIDPVTNEPFPIDTYFCIYNNDGNYQYSYEGDCE